MNRLAQETSPYLLQHAHNPVDWYAWKPEAFERAKAEQLPILVSIGYSTCHWCHVMERESFENEDVAAFMNEFFVNIKVDREERPDVDAIYMEACQILTGGGGWPLNVFLTPEGQPFYAGTYFPPRPAYNRPSWLQVLQHMVGVWQQKRTVVYEQAEKLMQHIRRNDDVLIEGGLGIALSQDTPDFDHAQIYRQMRERFDRADGGFGGAPKFPSTMALNYLLQYHRATGDPEALEHVFFSLEKMIYGGIYDQLGGGFARYATDREWLVPHFEKMLYDNALLVSVMSEAYKLAAHADFPGGQARADLLRETIEETLGYIAREMTHPDGGFYSAQDADSEGVEGKFFVWDKTEIDNVLGADAELFSDFYGVTAHGNWEEKNILWRNRTYAAAAADRGMSETDLRTVLARCRKQLFDVRSRRIWPGLDDKILLSWNALMTSAYVQAYTALGAESYREAAIKNLGFLMQKYTATDAAPGAPTLRHVWKNGRAQYDAFLEDYAFLIAALIDVYQITFDVEYLKQAAAYTEAVWQYFFDAASGLFFFTDARQSDIVLRKKDVYDNATPSGNSTMVQNLQRLGILLDRRDWRETAVQMLQRMQASVTRYPLSFERWASAMLTETQAMDEIAVVGDNALEKALALQSRFRPHMVIAASRTSTEVIPLLAHKTANPDAYIYVCRDFTCRQPVLTL